MFMALLVLLFIRPFISSVAFAYLNAFYYCLFWGVIIAYLLNKRKIFFKNKFLLKLLCFFSLSIIFSVIMAKDRSTALKYSFYYFGLLPLILPATLFDEREKTKAIQTVFTAALVVSILAIYQFFFGFKHLAYFITQQGINESFIHDYAFRQRVFFPFATPGLLASFLSSSIFLGLYLNKKLWLNFLLMLALVLTQSLSAILCFGFTFAVYILLFAKKRQIWFFVFFVFFVSSIIALVLFLRMGSTKDYLRPDFSITMRLNYWQETIEVIRIRPWFGQGPGNVVLEGARFSHNLFLQLWAESGIFAVTSFLWLIINGLQKAWSKIKIAQQKNILPLLAGLVVFISQNLLDFSFFLPETNFIFWLILGMLWADTERF